MIVGADREDFDGDRLEALCERLEQGANAAARGRARCVGDAGRNLKFAGRNRALAPDRGSDRDIAAGVVATGAEDDQRPLGGVPAVRGGVEGQGRIREQVRCNHGPISFSCRGHDACAMPAAGPELAFPPRQRTMKAPGRTGVRCGVSAACRSFDIAACRRIGRTHDSSGSNRADRIGNSRARGGFENRARRGDAEVGVGGLFGHVPCFGSRATEAPDFVWCMFAQTETVRKGFDRGFSENGQRWT